MLPATDSLAGSRRPGACAARRGDLRGATAHAGASDREAARAIFQSGKALVAHAAFVAGRLKAPRGPAAFDVLELFAFVRPGQPLVPSALGLARALGLGHSAHAGRMRAPALFAVARALLEEVARSAQRRAREACAAGRRPWRAAAGAGGRCCNRHLARETPHGSPIAGLEAWRGLPQWEDEAPVGTPGSQPVAPEEARARLLSLVGTPRPEQAAYSDAATYAFGPREEAGAPRIALVEAGTGTGKTLGYLAPASVWAEKNGPGLWISTYTRNLQRQIVQEIAHLYPDPVERAEKAVVRKGRENYLCLLNFEEAAKRTALAPGQRSVALGLIARWIALDTDGDLSGAGFPAFLAASLPLSSEITDRRGECIYAACPHYRICFIERAIRRARHAPIVVANHALVIAQAAQDWLRDRRDHRHARRNAALRYVFDEGHHLFDAADYRLRRRCCRAARWRSCAAGSAARKAAPAPACAGWKNG